MKKENREISLPSYLDFKRALYRIAGRYILLQQPPMEKKIS